MFFQARGYKSHQSQTHSLEFAVQRRNKDDSFGDCLSTRESYTLLNITPLFTYASRGIAHSKVSSVLDKIPLVFAQALIC